VTVNIKSISKVIAIIISTLQTVKQREIPVLSTDLWYTKKVVSYEVFQASPAYPSEKVALRCRRV